MTDEKNSKMMAVIHKRYGPPKHLDIEEIEKPVPKNNELLIQIHATTVTPSDIALRSGKFPLLFWIPVRLLFGVFRPRRLILGYEFSGIVESVGTEVSNFATGDEVFGSTYWKMSTNAEYICLPETSALAIIPSNLELFEAAAVPDGASTALHFLREAGIKPGLNVLIYGASGSIGTYAIQLAKHFDTTVTAVCSAKNFDLVKSLGADNVIDYTTEDYAKGIDRFDIVFDTVGKSSFNQARPVLTCNGIFVTTAFTIRRMLRSKWISLTSSQKLITGFTTSNSEKLKYLRDLIEKGQLKPVIDRVYLIQDIAKAHEYVEKRHKKGNVIVTIN